MDRFLLPSLCCIFFFVSVFADEKSQTFIGAVVEYGPVTDGTTTQDVVLKNIDGYADIINKIKSYKDAYKNLDIVVFPEHGLGNIVNKTIYGEPIPDPKLLQVPCLWNDSMPPALKKLSCLAQKQSVYLVVNVIETEKSNATVNYNSNVVFDRNGTVIARYRKYNLFGEAGITKPESVDYTYFDTDFGVRFGTFICFDIYFKKPSLELPQKTNATHYAFTAGWMSELPFLTATQEQSSWAYATNKVLLAANRNDPSKYGQTGTGIYLGQKAKYLSVMNQVKGNFAIVGQIPKDLSTIPISLQKDVIYFYNTSNPDISYLRLKQDDLECAESLPIPDGTVYKPVTTNITLSSAKSIQTTLCHKSVCCEFVVKLNSIYHADLDYAPNPRLDARGDNFGRYKYRLMAFDGVRGHLGTDASTGTQICAIVPCLDQSGIDKCGLRTDTTALGSYEQYGYKYWHLATVFNSVDITANITNKNTVAFPNALLTAPTSNLLHFGDTLDPTLYVFQDYTTTVGYRSARFYLNSTIWNPGALGIYSRDFDNDQNPVTKCDGTKISTTFPLLLLCSVLFRFIY